MTQVLHVGSLPVSDLVADAVIRTTPEATVTELAQVLTEQEVGILAVFDGEEVCGVVSERDVVHAVASGRDPATTSVGEIAHRDLVWCDAAATVSDVAMEMMDRYVRHVLVEDEGRLVAIVSARDLLGAYASSDLPADG